MHKDYVKTICQKYKVFLSLPSFTQHMADPAFQPLHSLLCIKGTMFQYNISTDGKQFFHHAK